MVIGPLLEYVSDIISASAYVLARRTKSALAEHISGIVPAEPYAEEQEAISRQLAVIDERLQVAAIRFSEIDRNLELAMELIENCYEAYRAPDDIRRCFNQAFYEKIYVDENGDPSGEHAAPFSVIVGNRVGLRLQEGKEPRDPILRAQGSQERHLVHRSEVFANLAEPLKALMGMVERGELASLLAGDPRPITSLHRGHQRRLSPSDVDQLVREYADGLGSVYHLAERWGVHRNTIAKHLRRFGLELGRLPLTSHEIERVRELRGRGLSLNAIGRAIGRDPKTARSALSEF